MRASVALALLAVLGAPTSARQSTPVQSTPPAAAARLSAAEQESFLQSARIVSVKSVSTGVTGTSRVTLTDGRITHDASVQTIDVYKPLFKAGKLREVGFRDTWRFNVAGYRLDRLVALGMVPVSVERKYEGDPASFTWWVDDVLFDEGERVKRKATAPDQRHWNEQMWDTRVFDQLIYNTDRNSGNLLVDRSWKIWLIDHSRAFRLSKELRAPETMSYLERQLGHRLESLGRAEVDAALGGYLTAGEVEGLMGRRDALLAHFKSRGPLAWYDRSRQ